MVEISNFGTIWAKAVSLPGLFRDRGKKSKTIPGQLATMSMGESKVVSEVSGNLSGF